MGGTLPGTFRPLRLGAVETGLFNCAQRHNGLRRSATVAYRDQALLQHPPMRKITRQDSHPRFSLRKQMFSVNRTRLLLKRS